MKTNFYSFYPQKNDIRIRTTKHGSEIVVSIEADHGTAVLMDALPAILRALSDASGVTFTPARKPASSHP